MTAQIYPDGPVRKNGDFISIAPAVCERLLGEPSARSPREWRWGNKGSFRLKLDTGTWNDFEAGESGGVLTLVMREERLDRSGAITWLEQHGFLRKQSENATSIEYQAHKRSPLSHHNPRSRTAGRKVTDRRGRDTLRWIRSQAVPVADSPDHPIRAWMRRRNLWRSDLPLPPFLRWIPSDALVFRRTHSGIGAIAFPLAPINAWRENYPNTPQPSAVQLVCIDANGERADYENSQGRRVDKPKFGNARLAVWAVGDVRGDSIIVCEGAADALALAARNPEPVIATLTTPRPALAWRDEISVFSSVTLWPDMDVEDQQGRRPGLDSTKALAVARKLDGQSVEVVGVDIGKDAADAAREAPLGRIDKDELNKFATELRAEGMTEFEALRYASTILR